MEEVRLTESKKIEDLKIKELPILEYLEIQLVDHCNLNCRACSHFCPLANENFANLFEFKRNMQELLKKVNLFNFRLLGGEPLLHSKIKEFIYESRKLLPNARISILTNGLLLPKMDENFWIACKNANVIIDITKYPVANNVFTEIMDICDKHEITIGGIGIANGFYHWMNQKGDSNPQETFNACKKKFGFCYIMRGSKISTCPTATYMDYYNNYFKKDIPVDKGIDIYENNGNEIVEHLKNPIDTCKYCANVLNLQRKPWEKTKKSESEWNCD